MDDAGNDLWKRVAVKLAQTLAAVVGDPSAWEQMLKAAELDAEEEKDA